MKGFDVLKVKSAVKARNKFDLSHSHLTTMDFGEIIPLLAEETVPGDEFNVSGDFFARMAPLVKPTYGKFQFKTLAGFVPYHQIADDAEAWLAGKTTWNGVTPVQRTFTVGTLHEFLVTYCLTSTGATSSNADYIFVGGNGSVGYYLFNKVGKFMAKILNALGYALPCNVDMQTTSTWYTTIRSIKLSAYPLLAFAKLYNDYMSQSQRYNTSALSTMLHYVKSNIAYSTYFSGGSITASGLNLILSNVKLCYENDYFTSAWQSPITPLSGLESVNGVGTNEGFPVQVTTSASRDNYLPLDAATPRVSQRALDFLKSFDDWVRRNNYSGSRDVQQIYSRFGIKPDEYRSNYAHVINTDSMPIQVGDVTATADTTNVPLGDYAGKGIMSGNKGFSYKADDFGMLFMFGWFTVTPMNSYGSDRVVLRNTPLDYYNPEFDGLGAEPISLGEVFASPLAAGDATDVTQDNAVFGYTERYNSYRYGRDKITGEFRDYRNSGDMNTWHTGRLLGDVRAVGNLVAQNTSVNTLPQTDSEYNRLFSVTSGNVNHFYLTCRFNVSAIRPMLNLNQVPRLGEGDTVVPRNGNMVS